MFIDLYFPAGTLVMIAARVHPSKDRSTGHRIKPNCEQEVTAMDQIHRPNTWMPSVVIFQHEIKAIASIEPQEDSLRLEAIFLDYFPTPAGRWSTWLP